MKCKIFKKELAKALALSLGIGLCQGPVISFASTNFSIDGSVEWGFYQSGQDSSWTEVCSSGILVGLNGISGSHNSDEFSAKIINKTQNITIDVNTEWNSQINTLKITPKSKSDYCTLLGVDYEVYGNYDSGDVVEIFYGYYNNDKKAEIADFCDKLQKNEFEIDITCNGVTVTKDLTFKKMISLSDCVSESVASDDDETSSTNIVHVEADTNFRYVDVKKSKDIIYKNKLNNWDVTDIKVDNNEVYKSNNSITYTEDFLKKYYPAEKSFTFDDDDNNKIEVLKRLYDNGNFTNFIVWTDWILKQRSSNFYYEKYKDGKEYRSCCYLVDTLVDCNVLKKEEKVVTELPENTACPYYYEIAENASTSRIYRYLAYGSCRYANIYDVEDITSEKLNQIFYAWYISDLGEYEDDDYDTYSCSYDKAIEYFVKEGLIKKTDKYYYVNYSPVSSEMSTVEDFAKELGKMPLEGYNDRTILYTLDISYEYDNTYTNQERSKNTEFVVDRDNSTIGLKENDTYYISDYSTYDLGVPYDTRVQLLSSKYFAREMKGLTRDNLGVHLYADDDTKYVEFTDTKRVVFGEVPSPVRNVEFNEDTKLLSWDIPSDEGLGYGEGHNEYVSIGKYIVHVLNSDGTLYKTYETQNNAVTIQSVPENYDIEIVAVNQIGVGQYYVLKKGPVESPIFEPTTVPTTEPTVVPTDNSTVAPTTIPTTTPVQTTTPGRIIYYPIIIYQQPNTTEIPKEKVKETAIPTMEPTVIPTATTVPSMVPADVPTAKPIVEPTVVPTVVPTVKPVEKYVSPIINYTKIATKKVGDDFKVTCRWTKIPKATGYYVYYQTCGLEWADAKVVKVKTPVYKFTKEDNTKCVKIQVKAYKNTDEGEKIIGETVIAHIAGPNNVHYNSNKVRVKVVKNKIILAKGKTAKIKASYNVTKHILGNEHAAKFRYRSSKTKIAKVTSNGKIVAKKKGKCKIFVYARNGYYKTITIVVK